MEAYEGRHVEGNSLQRALFHIHVNLEEHKATDVTGQLGSGMASVARRPCFGGFPLREELGMAMTSYF